MKTIRELLLDADPLHHEPTWRRASVTFAVKRSLRQLPVPGAGQCGIAVADCCLRYRRLNGARRLVPRLARGSPFVAFCRRPFV